MCVGETKPTDEVLEAINQMKAENQAQFNKKDLVRQPDHYAKWKIEPVQFIMENNLPYFAGNIVKYAVRAGHKQYEGMDLVESEITDLEKVMRYAEMRINQLKGKATL